MNFETKLRQDLAGALRDQGTEVVVDEIEAYEEGGDRILSVDFHLEGRWGSPARFTFPFVESIPIEQTLPVLRDLVARNWQTAHVPPGVSGTQPATLP